MEKVITQVCKEVFKTSENNIKIVSRLMGGMSNYTYIVEVDNNLYTFRIPGKKSNVFVDRKIEESNIKIVRNLGINNETIYLNIEKGYKIAKYIVGKPMHELNPKDFLEETSKVLHSIHDSNLKAFNDYKPFARLSKYEGLLDEFSYKHEEKYYELLNLLLSYKDFLDNHKKVICHGDSQVSNFVVSDKLYLMDWEFTGNNDPFYDIACFGNVDFSCALELLPIYLGKEPTQEDYNRLYLWRAFQCLQWHNVALYKEFIGLSKELKVDFLKVAKAYLTKAENFLGNVKQ